MSDPCNGSMDADKEREDGVHMNMNTKIEELLAVLKKKEDDKQKNTVLWVLAIIGAVPSSISPKRAPAGIIPALLTSA